jgi:hypothetical protein
VAKLITYEAGGLANVFVYTSPEDVAWPGVFETFWVKNLTEELTKMDIVSPWEFSRWQE